LSEVDEKNEKNNSFGAKKRGCSQKNIKKTTI
jgi:hypothetical protein